MGLLNDKRLANIRRFWNSNYKGQNLVPELLGHIAALEEVLKDGKISVTVGFTPDRRSIDAALPHMASEHVSDSEPATGSGDAADTTERPKRPTKKTAAKKTAAKKTAAKKKS